MATDLYWYCAECGDSDPVDLALESDTKRGDWETCTVCRGVSFALTHKEAGRLASLYAGGKKPSIQDVEAMLRKEAADG